MALKVKTTLNTYPVDAYRVIEQVTFHKLPGSKESGTVMVTHKDYPSAELAAENAKASGGRPGGMDFNARNIPIHPSATPVAPLTKLQPNGETVSTPVPDLPAYKDLIGVPISSWLVLAEGETLDGMSMHDLVFRLGYLIADKIPDNQSGTKV